MAKKRVHELAKQYSMPLPEVIKRLNAYGLDVKAAATAVDEKLADAALTGKPKPKAAAANGAAAKKPAAQPLQARAGFGHGTARAPRAENLAPPPKPKPKSKPKPGAGNSQRGDNGQRRPTRSSLQGASPGAGGGVRRVVIDSQASRRPGGPGGGPGGPGGGPGGPGGPNRPPRRRGGRRRRGTYEEPVAQDTSALKADVIRVNSGSTVKDVAEYLGVAVPEVIRKLMGLGEMATLTQTLNDDAIQVLADEFDKQIEIVTAAEDANADPTFEDDDDDLEPRPPVITIMGHVDHGKTSLLDAIRETEVAAGEAGGITQHIGAYQVHKNDKTITFLDTPGHEAFTAMRARGAEATDIAVIVVAADDGVRPQTREAVDHAKAADVPIVVAVNKIDKEGAQPDRVRTEMTQLGLQPEEWGGDTMFVDVSAKTHDGIDDLLEGLLLTAEIEELTANPDADASGTVIESKLDPGRGAVVTVLVQRGTLKIGDEVVAGAHWGRVRAMSDYLGKRVKTATPAEPVEILGFDTVPEAGEFVRVVENDRKARQIAGERGHRLKQEAQARTQRHQVLAGQAVRSAGGAQGARRRAQGRRVRLARGVRGRDREAAAGRDPGADRALGCRWHHRVRHQPGRGVGGHRDGLQRPPGRRGRVARLPRGRRDPHVLGHLPRDGRAPRRHGRHAGAGDRRGRRGHRRGARDVPCVEDRHHRRLHGHRRQGHARREGARHP